MKMSVDYIPQHQKNVVNVDYNEESSKFQKLSLTDPLRAEADGREQKSVAAGACALVLVLAFYLIIPPAVLVLQSQRLILVPTILTLTYSHGLLRRAKPKPSVYSIYPPDWISDEKKWRGEVNPTCESMSE